MYIQYYSGQGWSADEKAVGAYIYENQTILAFPSMVIYTNPLTLPMGLQTIVSISP